MALPENALASGGEIESVFLFPDSLEKFGLTDYERSGIDIQNPSQGINSQIWTCRVVGNNVYVQREGRESEFMFSRPNISEISFAFDQNMNPHFAYTVGEEVFLRWFDSVTQQFITTNFGTGRNPKLTMDDKRDTSLQINDILFAYMRGGILCYRQQRDRFSIERVLQSGLPSDIALDTIGMSSVLRIRFTFKPYLMLPTCSI